MNTYTGSPWQRLPPELRDALAPMDRFLREVGPAIGRISLGQNPDGSGATIGSPRIGVSDASTSLTDYLYLPGRTSGVQTVNGDVTFLGTVTLGGASVLSGAVSLTDSLFSILDNVDATKILQFQCSGIAPGTTRTLTAPNASGTVPTLENAHTVTGAWNFGDHITLNYFTFAVDATGGSLNYGIRLDDASGFFCKVGFATYLTADIILSLPLTSGQLVSTGDTSTLSNKTMHASTKIRCGITDTFFTKQTSTTVGFRFDTANVSAARLYRAQNIQGRMSLVGDATSAADVLGIQDLTAQTGSITAKTMLTASANSSGFFRVLFYLVNTVAGNAADTVKVTVAWNDGAAQAADLLLTNAVAAPAVPVLTHSLTTVGNASYGSIEVYAAASTAITFTTTTTIIGTPQYTCRSRIEALA